MLKWTKFQHCSIIFIAFKGSIEIELKCENKIDSNYAILCFSYYMHFSSHNIIAIHQRLDAKG